MARAAIYTVNAAAPTVAAGGTVPLGNTVRRFGGCIRQEGNAITLCGQGYFRVGVSATVTPTAAGTVTLAARRDGVDIIGAAAAATVAAVDTAASLSFEAIVRNVCDCDAATLSFVLTGGEAVLDNFAVVVERL